MPLEQVHNARAVDQRIHSAPYLAHLLVQSLNDLRIAVIARTHQMLSGRQPGNKFAQPGFATNNVIGSLTSGSRTPLKPQTVDSVEGVAYVLLGSQCDSHCVI